MERRTVIALVLVAAVMVLTPMLFPSARGRTPAPAAVADSQAKSTPASPAPAALPVPAVPSVAPIAGDSAAPAPVVVPPADVTVSDANATATFTTAGGSLRRVDLKTFKALDKSSRNVSLTAGQVPLLSYRIVAAGDTTALAKQVLALTQTKDAKGGDVLTFTGQAGPHGVTIRYETVPDSFLTRVSGTITGGAAGSGFLLVDMPETIDSYEADTTADHGALAYAIKSGTRSAEGVRFASLDPGERKVIAGPITWAAAKNKYFIVGMLPDSGNTQFVEAQVIGGPKVSRFATRAHGTVIGKLGADGRFAFDLYTGPQQYKRLLALGRDFENSNPYGGWLQGVVQPFATIVMKILLWMKATLGWSYGALLVLFGIAVRTLMWPLNQKAMRSTMKMQRLQPEMNALQTKYKSDPQKLQSEMMRLYKEHDMSPLSPLMGCLPMLLPMPILFALFFVFQNTIEFRGVPYLWLADISLKDPFYIVPLLMGGSMFLLSWIGLKNSPPNPQAKMMAYVMPVMMTVLFANFASGLNLYYAVQNIAAIPQQWLIANERSKAGPPAKA